MKTLSPLLFAIILLNSCTEPVNPDPALIGQLIILEDQMQRMNSVQTDRGNAFYMNIKEELVSSRGVDLAAKRSKLEHILLKMDQINKECDAIIRYTDDLKLELLKNTGNKTNVVKDNDLNTLIWSKNEGSTYIRPMRLNLSALENRNETGTAEKFFIGSNLETPTETGIELWEKLNKYRRKLVSIAGSYKIREREFRVDPSDINEFRTNNELFSKVESILKNQPEINRKEDLALLTDLYIQLTKQERITYHGKENVHWICASFNNANIVGAISVLTSLQQDILAARALALAHFSSKVSTCSYGFDRIMPMVSGPSILKVGEEIKLTVLIAALDSNQLPLVKTDLKDATVEYPGDGTGVISFKPTKSGEQTLKGTIMIKNSAGIEKTEEWEWKVVVWDGGH